MIPGAAGGEIPGHPSHSKKSAKGSKSVDMDKNRNANNNNDTPPTAAEVVPHGTPFTVGRLAAPYGAMQGVGVAATPTLGQNGRLEESPLPGVSVILGRTL